MKKYLFLILLTATSLLYAEDVRIRISQETIRKTLKELFNARAASSVGYDEENNVQTSLKLIYHPGRFNFYFLPGNTFKLECKYSIKTSSNFYAKWIQILGSNEGDINVYGEIYYDNANGHIYARLTNPFIWTLLPPFDLGSFRDFFSETSLEYFETSTPTLTTDNGELVIGLQTKAGIILIADQFRESGVRTANSTIGQWNGSSFTEHTVPKVFNLTKNS